MNDPTIMLVAKNGVSVTGDGSIAVRCADMRSSYRGYAPGSESIPMNPPVRMCA